MPFKPVKMAAICDISHLLFIKWITKFKGLVIKIIYLLFDLIFCFLV